MAALALKASLLSALGVGHVYNDLPKANDPKAMLKIEILIAV